MVQPWSSLLGEFNQGEWRSHAAEIGEIGIHLVNPSLHEDKIAVPYYRKCVTLWTDFFWGQSQVVTFVYIVMNDRILQKAGNCLTNCSIASWPIVNNSWPQFHKGYREASSVFTSRVYYIVNIFVWKYMCVFELLKMTAPCCEKHRVLLVSCMTGGALKFSLWKVKSC